MTDLSNLPEDVRLVLGRCDVMHNSPFHTDVSMDKDDYQTLRDYILRVTAERDELQGANEYRRLALESVQNQFAEMVAKRDALAKLARKVKVE